MASVKEIFNSMIGKAIENAGLIESPRDKAMAYAAIAQALATTGKIGDDVAISKESKPAKQAKNADKLKRQPKNLEPEDVKEEEKAEEKPKEDVEETTSAEEPVAEAPDTEEDNEWTDEAQDKHAEELEYLEEFIEKWGEDGLAECVKEFSKGTLKNGFDDVTPGNIKAIVIYLKEIVDTAA